jgi:tetratricopeptide (TPR) repeat protein
MRAEHRHELKTNELAEWLSNLPAWVNQHIRTIIYGGGAVVIVVAAYLYYLYQQTVVTTREQNTVTAIAAHLLQQRAQIAQQAVQGVDTSYMLLQIANELENIAARTKQDSVAALALIKNAEVLRTELQFRQGTVTRQDIEGQINRAKEKYSKALDIYLKRTPNRSLEGLAKLGLGLCEEDLGNIEDARKMYNELATNPGLKGTTAAAAAKQRLELMDFYATKISLKPAPRPPPAAIPAQSPPAGATELQPPSVPQQGPLQPAVGEAEANSPASN